RTVVLAVARRILAERDVELPVQRVFDLPVRTRGFQECLRRQLARQREDAHVGGGLAVDLPRGLNTPERLETFEPVILGQALGIDHYGNAVLNAAVRLRLGPGGRRRFPGPLRLLGRQQAGARVRPQRFLVALERDAVVAALLDDL